MTEKQAIKIRSAFSNGFQFPFGNGSVENCDMAEVDLHADLLDEAITRQIPKKPLLDECQPLIWTTMYNCPNCDCKFTGGNTVKFCYQCGQRLDWDERQNSKKKEG